MVGVRLVGGGDCSGGRGCRYGCKLGGHTEGVKSRTRWRSKTEKRRGGMQMRRQKKEGMWKKGRKIQRKEWRKVVRSVRKGKRKEKKVKA